MCALHNPRAVIRPGLNRRGVDGRIVQLVGAATRQKAENSVGEGLGLHRRDFPPKLAACHPTRSVVFALAVGRHTAPARVHSGHRNRRDDQRRNEKRHRHSPKIFQGDEGGLTFVPCACTLRKGG